MGKFSHKEVACVMERRYFDNPLNARARAGAAEQPSHSEKFMVVAGECRAAGAVWWTRRGVCTGEAGRDDDDDDVLLWFCLVVCVSCGHDGFKGAEREKE